MAAYQSLPWLPSSDQFLRAIEAGGQAGLQRERLAQDAAQFQPRMMTTSFGPISGPESDPRADIMAQKLKAENDDRAKIDEAWNLHNDLIRRGATPQEAYDQAGLERYGVRPPASPWETLSLGQGEVARVNKATGHVDTLQPGREKPETGPTVSVPIYPEGVNPITAHALGIQPTTVRGTPSKIASLMGANAPSFLNAAGTHSAQPLPESKDDLKKGVTYQTARGPAVWDGDSFEAVNTDSGVAKPSPNMFQIMGNTIGSGPKTVF